MTRKDIIGFIWECSCGNVEQGEDSPEECFECGRLNSFVQLPDEIVEEREREALEEDMGTSKEIKISKKTSKKLRRKK